MMIPRRSSLDFGLVAVLLAFLTSLGGNPAFARTSSQASAAPNSKWQLVWSDEFDGANGSSPDVDKWAFDLGGRGWGNQELETYTDRPSNVHVENGNLVITAFRETYTGTDGVKRDYTSARIKTAKHFSQAYGRIEARIKIPAGQGMWPAFWMMGDDSSEVGWPKCGEIDIMENIGKEPFTVHGTIHGPGYSGADGISTMFTLAGGTRFADDFHVFAAEWEENVLRFYVDDALYRTIKPFNLPAGTRWVFDHPFYIILNLAVGGSWPGSPDSSTVFPRQLLVDYVRVYKLVP